MGVSDMIKYTIRLESQPGGIRPELRLKTGTTSAGLMLIIPPKNVLVNAEHKRCVLMAKLPDGTDLFVTGYTEITRREISASFFNATVSSMAVAEGRYKCTLTILDTNAQLTRETYKDYNFLTVLPFTVIVSKRA